MKAFRVVELILDDGSSPYAQWFASLDPIAAAKVTVAKVRMEQGNLSNYWVEERKKDNRKI